MSKNLQEAIENVGMVNNVDGQNFDKDFVGTAPVSYADAVLKMRAKREQAKKGCEEHTKTAMETLKKEISNAEHPEPLDKVKVSDDGKITLNEALFESFDDEHLGKQDDVCPVCGKDPCECKVEESYLKEASNHIIPVKNKRKIIIVEDEASIECILNTFTNTTSNTLGGGSTYYSVVFNVISDSIPPSFGIYFKNADEQETFYESVPKKFDTVKQFVDYLTEIYDSYSRTDADYNIRNIARKLGYKDVVNIEESLIRYPNGMEITDIDLDKALDYQYGTDRDKDNSKYTDDEKQRAVTYWIKKTDPSPYNDSTDDLEESSEKLDWDSTKKVLKQHLSKIPKGAMSRANIRDVLVVYCNYSSKEANDFVAKLGVSGVRNLIDESLSKEEVEPLEESKEDAKVFRVTYKHSPEVFSSVMVKASNEDEAKKKFKVKYPNKEIIAVTAMMQSEVDDMKRRGMSLFEAKIIDAFDAYVPWDEAVLTYQTIEEADKLSDLEQLIDDMYPDGIEVEELNELLSDDYEWVYSMLGMSEAE